MIETLPHVSGTASLTEGFQSHVDTEGGPPVLEKPEESDGDETDESMHSDRDIGDL